MSQTRKILIITPKRLGDTVFTTPAIRFIKQAYPNSQLDVIALSKLSGDTLRHNPYIDNLIVTPDQIVLESLAGKYELGLDLYHSEASDETFSKLNIDKSHHFAIDIHGQHQALQALTFTASHISSKIMLSDTEKRYDIFPQPENVEKVKNLLEREHVDLHSELLIGCHLGCHGLTKKRSRIWGRASHKKAWPIKNYIKLEHKLKKINPNIRFVITGSKEEKSLGEKIMKRCPTAINLIDKTSVLDLAALMKFLKLYLCPDTGAMHVACATDVNLVALFGKTSPQLTGPFPEKENRIVLRQQDLSKLPVQQVAEACLKFLEIY